MKKIVLISVLFLLVGCRVTTEYRGVHLTYPMSYRFIPNTDQVEIHNLNAESVVLIKNDDEINVLLVVLEEPNEQFLPQFGDLSEVHLIEQSGDDALYKTKSSYIYARAITKKDQTAVVFVLVDISFKDTVIEEDAIKIRNSVFFTP